METLTRVSDTLWALHDLDHTPNTLIVVLAGDNKALREYEFQLLSGEGDSAHLYELRTIRVMPDDVSTVRQVA